jgi:hypothetical protein
VKRCLSVIACLLALAAPATALSASKASAQRAAREAARDYAARRWGIGGTAHDWKARCARSATGGRWTCRMSGPCAGSLRLQERSGGRFSAYDQRLHCGD